MKDIALYIFKKYGYKLTTTELDTVIKWFEANEAIISDEKDLDLKLRSFLFEKFPDKELYLCDEDTSNMNYLLSMLKNRNN